LLKSFPVKFSLQAQPDAAGVRTCGVSQSKKPAMPAKKKGLYANINAKKKRIAKGSGEKMRKLGQEGAPTKQAFKESAKTAKK
jgi:hypothetical protein